MRVESKMKSKERIIYLIRQMITAITAFCVLVWAFPKNNLFGRVVICPFLICSVMIFFEDLFLLLNKENISNIFKYIFRVVFLVYILGFSIYIIYYSIVNKSYSLIVYICIFLVLFWIMFGRNLFID